MPGRRRKLNRIHLREIDRWYAQPCRKKKPPAKVLAAQFRCSDSTILNAARRVDAYAEIPR
jgi:hypothetical protein